MADLLELAARCEAAEGPDRDIDGWIAVLIDPDRQTIVDQKPGRFPREPIYGPTRLIMESIGGKDGADYIAAPEYTASLDAAMTLAPWDWLKERELRFSLEQDDWPKECWVGRFDQLGDGGHTILGTAETAALAICAASLRALSESSEMAES